MRVLIIGAGGREHALAWKMRQSPQVEALFCAPGNAGTAAIATNLDLEVSNSGALALWALENRIDLTVVGPEEPLSRGVVDIFEEHGLRIFGPTKEAAQLETSKSFAKDVMIRAGVKTPAAAVFEDFEQAKEFVISHGAPLVVKADGLAAGKGVVVVETIPEALAALEEFMLHGRHGQSGKTILIEEKVVGREASIMALVDGDVVLPLVISQDFKRLEDGDRGPNTGGMGAISPTPVLGEKFLPQLVSDIFLPVVSDLWSIGIRYRGFLYAGVIVDKDGVVKVLEFNCRLGDPETQVLMMRLQSDLLEVINAAVNGRLASVDLRWKPEAAACIVAASRGYPGTVDDGKPIAGLFPDESDRVIFHAGTTRTEGGESITKGGRILSVTALGKTLNQALSCAYQGLERISFEGMHYRRDIGGGQW